MQFSTTLLVDLTSYKTLNSLITSLILELDDFEKGLVKNWIEEFETGGLEDGLEVLKRSGRLMSLDEKDGHLKVEFSDSFLNFLNEVFLNNIVWTFRSFRFAV